MAVDSVAVLIVDDHEVVRAGLRSVLLTHPLLAIVGEAVNGEDACVQAAALRPEIVIMDLSMPVMNGADATRRILKVSPASRVIALTAYEEAAYVRDLFKAGARGYVLKRAVVRHLLRAVDVVVAGGVFLDPDLATRPAGANSEGAPFAGSGSGDLSTREVDVATLAAQGHSNAEMAKRLKISVKTVETHKGRLMFKLGLGTRAELVRYAIYRGWLRT